MQAIVQIYTGYYEDSSSASLVFYVKTSEAITEYEMAQKFFLAFKECVEDKDMNLGDILQEYMKSTVNDSIGLINTEKLEEFGFNYRPYPKEIISFVYMLQDMDTYMNDQQATPDYFPTYAFDMYPIINNSK